MLRHQMEIVCYMTLLVLAILTALSFYFNMGQILMSLVFPCNFQSTVQHTKAITCKFKEICYSFVSFFTPDLELKLYWTFGIGSRLRLALKGLSGDDKSNQNSFHCIHYCSPLDVLNKHLNSGHRDPLSCRV